MSYLNIPSIFITMSQNQKNDIKDLENYGHYFLLEKNDLKKIEISNLIRLFVKNYSRIAKLNYSKKIFLNKKGLDLIIKKTKLS